MKNWLAKHKERSNRGLTKNPVRMAGAMLMVIGSGLLIPVFGKFLSADTIGLEFSLMIIVAISIGYIIIIQLIKPLTRRSDMEEKHRKEQLDEWNHKMDEFREKIRRGDADIKFPDLPKF